MLAPFDPNAVRLTPSTIDVKYESARISNDNYVCLSLKLNLHMYDFLN